MRKIFSSIVLVAAAAMTFASCQREEMNAPKETFSTTLTLNTEVEATKTYLGTDNTVLWGENESVILYFQDGATNKDGELVPQFISSASTSNFKGKASAEFSFTIDNVTEASEYVLGGIYPASASNGISNDNAAKYKIALPATQNASVNNYDPSAFIMVLKPETVHTVPSTYTASFRRAVALNKITLTGVKENISSVEITVPEGKYLAGRRYVDLITAESGDIFSFQTNTVTVNAPYTGETIDVWFTSWGVELDPGEGDTPGEELTIKMTSATKTYTRTITAKRNGIKFIEGNLNTLKVDMSSAKEEVSGLLADGDYLITGVVSSQVYAATAYVEGNNLKSVQISVADDKIQEVDGLSDCKMTLTKVTDGECAGMYTITDVNGKYLYAASNSANQLKSRVEPDKNSYWTIKQEDDGTYSVVASMSSNRNVMQMNPNDGTPLFSCYATLDLTKYVRITLYPYSMVVQDTTPKVTVVEGVERTIGAGGGNLTFTCKLKNLDGETLSIEESTEELTSTVSGNVVTVTVAENITSDQKTFNATIRCGSVGVPITITQEGKPAEGVAKEYTVTYAVSSKTAVTTSGTAPTGSNATFAATYTTATQITANNTQTYTLSGYAGCVIKSVTLSMHANSSKGAGKLLLKAGNQTLASISSATDFNKWYNNTTFGTDWRDVNVTLTNDSYNIGANENVVLVLTSTTNSIYCQSVTITYEATGSAEGGETPDPEQPTGPQTHLYTFTSKSWADNTDSWTSGKDGNQMQSGRGVQVTTGVSGANATGKSSMSNVSKVVVVYSTNASAGAGKIKISIGNTELESTVTKTGGTSDRSLEFDFTSSYPTGIPKITVTCTANSIYVKSVEITTN